MVERARRHREPHVQLKDGQYMFGTRPVYKWGLPRTTSVEFEEVHIAVLQTYITEMRKLVRKDPDSYNNAVIEFNKQGLNPKLLPQPKR